jgi:tetratricopeptide (TPR) repeat protein
MGWLRRLSPGRLTLAALLLTGGLALPARGADGDNLSRQLTALNRLTGDGPRKGRLREVLKSPDKGKALVSYAWGQLKDGKRRISYNTAFVLGQAALEAGNYQAGAAFFRHCGRMAVKLESTSKIVQSYGGLIDLFYENKRYEDAARVCRELLEMKPTTEGRPRIVLLAVTNRLGDADFEELETYNPAGAVQPAVQRIHIQAVTKQGKYDEAIKMVDRLVNSQDDWQVRELKGWVLREAGKYAEAAKVYEDVLQRLKDDKEQPPKKRDKLEDSTRYILSNIYVETNQIDKAAEELQTLVKKHPDEPGYQNDLGYIWADHDMHLQKAEKLIRRALDLDREQRQKNPKLDTGENGAYLDSLGWVLYKQKKFKEAKEALQKAVEDKASQHIEIYDHLGDVCMALGERQAAVNAWRRGVEVAGPSPREQRRRADVERKIEQAKGAASNR